MHFDAFPKGTASRESIGMNLVFRMMELPLHAWRPCLFLHHRGSVGPPYLLVEILSHVRIFPTWGIGLSF